MHRRWRVQQSATLCTLLTTGYLKYIRGCVNTRIFSYLPAELYKLYNIRIPSRRRVHRRSRVQQPRTLCTLVTTEYLKYIRDCVYNSIFYYLSVDVYNLYNIRIHVRWRVHKRWRVQQSTTSCTLVTTEYFKYLRGCVYNSIFYYLSVDVYNLYNVRIHVRWRVHRRWRVQQSTTSCTLVTTEYFKYIRGCVYNSIFYYLPGDVYKLYNRRIHFRREYKGGGEYSSRQRCVHW